MKISFKHSILASLISVSSLFTNSYDTPFNLAYNDNKSYSNHSRIIDKSQSSTDYIYSNLSFLNKYKMNRRPVERNKQIGFLSYGNPKRISFVKQNMPHSSFLIDEKNHTMDAGNVVNAFLNLFSSKCNLPDMNFDNKMHYYSDITYTISDNFGINKSSCFSTTNKSLTSDFTRDVDNYILFFINKERTSRNIHSLTENKLNNMISHYRTVDMVLNNYFSHNSHGDINMNFLRQYFLKPGSDSSYITENIQIVEQTNMSNAKKIAKQIVKKYMESKKGHRENILDSRHDYFGTGSAVYLNKNNRMTIIHTNIFTRIN